jgi:hypothetical protein
MSRGDLSRGFDDLGPGNGLDLPEDPFREAEPDEFPVGPGESPPFDADEPPGYQALEQSPLDFSAGAQSQGPGSEGFSSELAESPGEETSEEPEEKKKGGGFLSWLSGMGGALRQTSPYVVMLALSLLALVVGTAILVGELWRYNFEFRPPQ